MQPLLSTPWDGLIPAKAKVPTLALVHSAKTTFVNGVNPFVPPVEPTLEELLSSRGELKPGELFRAVLAQALQFVNANPGATASSTAHAARTNQMLVSRALRTLAKRGEVECVETVHEGVRKFVYWPKGAEPAAVPVQTLEQKVVAFLEENPGVSGRQVADHTKSESVFSMLNELVKNGRAHVEGAERWKRYFATGTPAHPRRRRGGGTAPSIPRETVLELREKRANGVPWIDLVQQYKVGRRAMWDAVRGIGAYERI